MAGSVTQLKKAHKCGDAKSPGLALRARFEIERMGSVILENHTDVALVDAGRLFYELRIVVLRILIQSAVSVRTNRVNPVGSWEDILELDLESQLFHMEQLGDDRIWAHESVSAVRRDFFRCGGKWFGEVVEGLVGDGVEVGEIGAVDEYLMGLSAVIVDKGDGGGLVLQDERESARKSGGVFYTPASVVGYVLDRALSPAIEGCGEEVDRLLGLRVCDPSCGCGYFLIEAARRIAGRIAEVGGGDVGGRLADVIRGCVFGGDVNPVTAEVCRWSLWLACGDESLTVDELRGNVVRGDALIDEGMFGDDGFGGFDVVVGNPPFLNQLGSGTARSRERVEILRARGLVGGAAYTDEASAFLVLGLGMVVDGGRVCMVQPQSVVATKGGAWARSRAAELGVLESIWVSNEHVFGDASVYTCAPCVVVGAGEEFQSMQRPLPDGRGSLKSGEGVRRFSGGEFVEHESLRISQEEFGRLATWSSIVAVTMGVPEVLIESCGVVGDVATATADFRDEYYGLVGKLIEDAGCDDRAGSPAVLTTGLVDLGVCNWGKKATRIHKRRWEGPRVLASGIVGDERLGKWVDARRVEKVVVATQTKVVEAFVDVAGEFVVLTPMISVMVRRPDCAPPQQDGESGHPPEVNVWMVGAAIGSPVCSAFAMRFFGGAAMHADALKMSARQVLGLPLPVDYEAWLAGAAAFERVHSAGEDEYASAISVFGEAMCGAYGVVGEEREELMGWWLKRLGIG